ncbi:putative disease resistance protein [Gossypium australe]|uniref:Putative disease resistance protein n=1 Tax=Gossypium australe TaxID=47621 RepID=A0A5B6VUE0_9ROSI|nr:putative disease resistance protein [Gossypium australe]
MPGVGKTLLVKEVSRQVQEGKLLDSMVMAIVSPTPNIQKIQDQIAMLLVLKIVEKSMIVRGHKLCERLRNEKKVLIVLDDIWKKLDLEEAGIPFRSQHKGCTILLTSKDQNVLRNEMDATKTRRR